jgi:AraC-like DNA-binding protein
MHLASTWLRGERLTVSEVAGRLGYESEASFSRAFKRFVGVPPSTLRRPRAENHAHPELARRPA